MATLAPVCGGALSLGSPLKYIGVVVPATQSKISRMPIVVLSAAQIAGILLGLAGLFYLVLALRATFHFHERAGVSARWHPPVSVLKPVFGSPPHLYECLRSFCDQDWPTYEVIFGAHSDGDPAVAVVQRLIREFPDRSLRLVVDGSPVGPNRKVSNLANIYKAAKHDTLLLADSDLRVDRNCIAAMVAPLVEPSVGAVASIYKGYPIGGAVSNFGALYINDWFAPSVLVDVELRGIDFVFAMSTVRRRALEAIGGLSIWPNSSQMISPWAASSVAMAGAWSSLLMPAIPWWPIPPSQICSVTKCVGNALNAPVARLISSCRSSLGHCPSCWFSSCPSRALWAF